MVEGGNFGQRIQKLWNKVRGKNEDEEASPLVKAAAGYVTDIIDTGTKTAIMELIGYEPDEFKKAPADGDGNPVLAFAKRKAGEFVNEVAMESIAESKPVLTENLKVAVKEGVVGIRKNLKEGIDAVNERLPEDDRSTYEQMKSLLGVDETKDGFFIKLAKKIGARLLSFAMPVATLVSAKIASRFTSEAGSESDYRDKFKKLYSGALGFLAPKSA